MVETLTIHLDGPVAAVHLAEASGASTHVRAGELEIQDPKSELQDAGDPSQELAHLCELVRNLADRLSRLHEQMIANQRGEIAKLAVEIARRVLAQKVTNRDYEIQAVIEEALKRAPTRQNILVRVNPQDMPACQKIRQDAAEGPFSGVEFIADWSVAAADCLVETPKGIIRSFAEQHLERISEALGRVE
jgi:flagellar biosynthesis/type III secretory pathway protein FliH